MQDTETEAVIFKSLNSGNVTIKKEEILELGRNIYGKLYLRGNAGYDSAREIWNGMFAKKPSAIIQCRGTYDVILAVNFARKYNILTTIKSGGHNITGSSVMDDALTIDLSKMNGVFVDEKNRIAMAQGGALLGDVDRETQIYGLATPFGVVSKTGIAGLTLGGGYGHLRRKYGLTIDNLIGVQMVLADGSLVYVDEKNYPDLFWAIRGAGGNFGIVTRFDYKLHRIGPNLMFQYTVYDLKDAERVFDLGRKFMLNEAPPELSAEFQLAKFPASENVPVELRGRRCVVLRSVYSGDPDTGMKTVEPLRNLSDPVYDNSSITSYIWIQSYSDGDLPNGWNYYSTGIMVPDITKDLVGLMKREYEKVSFSYSAVTGIWHTGGAIKSIAPEDTSYSARDNNFMIVIDCGWPDSSENEKQIEWGRSLKKKIKTIYPDLEDTGYINFQTFDNMSAEVRSAYGSNLPRLAEIKAKYDPDNFFRMNHNIPPAKSQTVK